MSIRRSAAGGAAKPSRHSAATEIMVPALRTLEALGGDVAQRASEAAVALLSAAGVPIEGALDPSIRVPHETAVGLLENALEITGDPSFALRAGRSTRRGDLGVYQLLASTAATLRESLVLSERYIGLLHDGSQVALVESGDTVRWEHRVLPGLSSPASANDYVMAAFLAGAQQNIGIAAPPLEVWLMHDEPAAALHRAAYDACFGTRVRFGTPRNALVMPRAALDLPLRFADPALRRVLMRYAEDLSKRLPRTNALVERARAFVRKNLARDASLGALAATLHMSESSVQRKLLAQGTSHSELVDVVRRELATELLESGELNISEIAFRLGFAHRPAFHRAFRRWFGVAPKAHRAGRAHDELYRFYKRGT
jgi:AraC-like DNA-binding protein